jgi:hypothetical protein
VSCRTRLPAENVLSILVQFSNGFTENGLVEDLFLIQTARNERDNMENIILHRYLKLFGDLGNNNVW